MSVNMGRVERLILDTTERDGMAFFGLIDPASPLEKSVEYAKAFHEGGADVILIGGSLGIVENGLNDLVGRIKEASDLPVMLYPGNINGVAANADALYFMSLMNSNNPYWITGAQALAAPSIAKLDIDIIPTSLLIIEPGETVGWVGEARAIPNHKPDIAVAFALAGKFLGHRVTILERGSGAPGPASPEMFRLVKQAVQHPVICAGSCRTIQDIEQTVLAGADGIHVASIIQQASNPFKKAKEVISAAKDAGRRKLKAGK